MAGFDFQINPYRHGGQPRSVTSVPYPVQAEEAFDSRTEGAFDVELLQNLESIDPVMPVALDGTMRGILLSYSHLDSFDAIQSFALDGVLDTILRVIDMPLDSIDPVTPRALSGVLDAILIVIEEETDSFDSVTAVAQNGGTLQ